MWNPIKAKAEANGPWPKAEVKPLDELPLSQEEETALVHLNGIIEGWTVKQQGTKSDAGKPPMDLLDPEFLEGVAAVLGFGADKYAAHNWRSGINYSRLIGAAYRHLGAINKGEDIDPESGKPHVFHLGCCVMFLSWMMKHRQDLDDRWKK